MTATLDGVVHIDFGQVERGHEAKQKSRADRDGRQVNEYLRIHRKIEPWRFHKLGDVGIQPLQSGEGNHPSEQTAGEREDDTLDQKLPDDARASRPKRNADRNLSRPYRGAGQQQISNVGAGDSNTDPTANNTTTSSGRAL